MPLVGGVESLTLPAGLTIAELLAAAGLDLPEGVEVAVCIDRWEVPRDLWHRVRPKPGRLVSVRLLPAGGGGGGGGSGGDGSGGGGSGGEAAGWPIPELHLLFLLGFGPLEIGDLRFGETPIDRFEGVEVEIRPGRADDAPITLYEGCRFTQHMNALLEVNGSQRRVAAPDADGLGVRLVFPRGLYRFDGAGIGPQQRDFTVEQGFQAPDYETSGTIHWVQVKWWQMQSWNNDAPIHFGLDWTVDDHLPQGVAYRRNPVEVRVTCIWPYDIPTEAVDDCQWTELITVRHREAVTHPGIAKIAMRVRGSEHLQGAVEYFNCMATSIFPDFDAAANAWVERPTTNPASIFAGLARGPAMLEPLGADEIDWPTLQTWHALNLAHGRDARSAGGGPANAARGCNYVFARETTVRQALRLVAAVGRASPTDRGGLLSVVLDEEQTAIKQVFTEENTWDFQVARSFVEPPDGVRVRYLNAEKGYQADELLVPLPGHEVASVRRWEVLDLDGVTHAKQAWDSATYYLQVLLRRGPTYTCRQDIEHLRCRRGDLCRLAHTVLDRPVAAGRIVAVERAGDQAVGLHVDTEVVIEAGVSYAVTVRPPDGPVVTAALAAHPPGVHLRLALAAPLAAPGVTDGDLFVCGPATLVEREVIVIDIAPEPDLTATLTLRDAAPEAWAEPPPLPPGAPGPGPAAAPAPPATGGAASTGTR